MTEPTKEDLDQVPVFLEALRAVAPSVPPVDEAAAEIAALKAKLKEAEEVLEPFAEIPVTEKGWILSPVPQGMCADITPTDVKRARSFLSSLKSGDSK